MGVALFVGFIVSLVLFGSCLKAQVAIDIADGGCDGDRFGLGLAFSNSGRTTSGRFGQDE